jgi:hypothetical protein
MVTITYNWMHSGHTPGSIRDMASSPISADARKALGQLIANKMDWRSIKHLLRSDRASLGVIMNSGPLSETVRVDYNAIRYAIRKHMEKCANLDRNLARSLEKWSDKIVGDGGHCFTRDLESMNSGVGVFVFGFCTDWQLDVSRLNPNEYRYC